MESTSITPAPKWDHSKEDFVVLSRKKFKIIPEGKYWINKNTPVGDDAEFWERMPHGGRREFHPVAEISNGLIKSKGYYVCWMKGPDEALQSFAKEKGLVWVKEDQEKINKELTTQTKTQ